MIKLSVVIITFNEEKNIERCIKSVLGIADEIVVLDSFSSDRTKNICQTLPVCFYEQVFLGYSQQKNKALEYATYPWVLSLDADEEVSEKLYQSLLKIKELPQADAFYVNRLTNYCGTWIKHTDWYPDRKIRLWDTRKGKWEGLSVHEQVKMVEGAKFGRIKGDLYHYSIPSITYHLNTIENYTSLMAKEAILKNKVSGWFYILFSPFQKFIKSYFFRLGFLDGYHGFLVSFLSAYATFIKYIKIKELKDSIVVKATDNVI